jgi:hypothetical protein
MTQWRGLLFNPRYARSHEISRSEKAIAIVAVYPMPDFGVLSEEDAETGREDLERRIASKEISFGEEFANSEAEMVYYTRWTLICYIVKAPVYADYFSGISGLGKKLMSVQSAAPVSYKKVMDENVPTNTRHISVVDFENLTPGMPPLFVVHGLADSCAFRR